jgi:hypothetical protein
MRLPDDETTHPEGAPKLRPLTPTDQPVVLQAWEDCPRTGLWKPRYGYCLRSGAPSAPRASHDGRQLSPDPVAVGHHLKANQRAVADGHAPPNAPRSGRDRRPPNAAAAPPSRHRAIRVFPRHKHAKLATRGHIRPPGGYLPTGADGTPNRLSANKARIASRKPTPCGGQSQVNRDWRLCENAHNAGKTANKRPKRCSRTWCGVDRARGPCPRSNRGSW